MPVSPYTMAYAPVPPRPAPRRSLPAPLWIAGAVIHWIGASFWLLGLGVSWDDGEPLVLGVFAFLRLVMAGSGVLCVLGARRSLRMISQGGR